MIIRKKKGRQRKKFFKILLIFITLLILILGIVLIVNMINKKDKEVNNEEIIASKEEKYKLSLIMAGDMLVHDKIYNEARKNANNNGYDFKPMLTYIKDIVKDYDLAYYNEEVVLGGTSIGLSSYPAFNSPYEVGLDMIDTGFNMVSLATNHTLDRGIKAIENSLDFWNSTDVYTSGSYKTMEERNNIEIKEKNNITYAMLNYTYGTNGIKRPNGYESYINIWDMSNKNSYEEYKNVVKQDIENIRDKVDVLIVAMHFGEEYNFNTTWYQEDSSNFLSSLGVDIVIGTHSHVVGPIKWINNTLVIYSLGNFLSAHEVVNISNRIGLLSSIDIVKEVKDNNTTIKLENLNNDLIYTYHNNYKDFMVIGLSNSDIYNYLDNYHDVYNRYADIIRSSDKRIHTAVLSD